MSLFSDLEKERILFQDEHFLIIRDGYPVSPGHLLVISNRVVESYFDLTDEERAALGPMILKAKGIIEAEHKPSGYNIGMNCGLAAGQTVMHFHCHLIPRYDGDVENPRGGVRGVIPGKMNYKTSP
jgi:diadenosine tetraphosphate (Ap4A) HIT family hydrolase